MEVDLCLVGKKGPAYFGKRETPIVKSYNMGQAPNAEEASAISEFLLASYLAGETVRFGLVLFF